jgi:hypothetical protein
MQFESGSNAAFATGVTLYAGPANASKGVYWKGSMNSPGIFVPPPAVVPGSAGGKWTNKYYADGSGFPNHGVTLFIGDDESAGFNTAIADNKLIDQILPFKAGQPSGFRIAARLVAPGFINTNAEGTASGPFSSGVTRISASDSPYSVPDGANLIEVDASGGDVQLNLQPVGTYISGQTFIVKRVDSDATAVHTVTIRANSAAFDNVKGGEKILRGTAAGSLHSITFYASSGNNWYTIAAF